VEWAPPPGDRPVTAARRLALSSGVTVRIDADIPFAVGAVPGARAATTAFPMSIAAFPRPMTAFPTPTAAFPRSIAALA